MNASCCVKKVLIVFLTTILFVSSALSQAFNSTSFDRFENSRQLYRNADSLISFCVRPAYFASIVSIDSIYTTGSFKKINTNGYLQNASKQAIVLPLTWQQQYNEHHTYGFNDGSMIPAKGYQTQISFGAFFKKGLLSLQLQPEFVFAQNAKFPSFPSQHSDSIWRNYYSVLNMIDAPEKFGSGSYVKLFPGQSALRFNYRKISIGVSSENLWWGPGVRNSLLMSNNAPGFFHFAFNTIKPVATPVGSFEWQVIAGKLKSSNVLPDTTKKNNGQPLYVPKQKSDRYINGMVLTWQPKWMQGLFLGLSRVFYQYSPDVECTFEGYVPVIGKFFKRHLLDEDERKRDQMISFFFRLPFTKEKAELYAEYGRNDHSEDIRDFFLEPEHSKAYILGFSKIFESKFKALRLFGEVTNLQGASTALLRAQPSWYMHHQVRHGYTNHGQVIGAGIGPGGSSQTLGLEWGSGIKRTGGFFERIVHNNDFYYSAFAPSQNWQKHWIDLSLNFTKNWSRGRILYDARLSLIHSLNYEWYYSNVFNCSASLGISYLL
jgi:hypothetical protein